MVSPSKLGAVGGEPFRTASMSSSVLLDQTPQNTISKEEHQQIEAKKLQIEYKMRDLQLDLFKLYDTHTNLREQEVHVYLYS